MKLKVKAFNGNKLSKEMQEQILQNVLEKCGKNSYSIPFESIAEYSGYRGERYILIRAAIIIVLIVFLLLPVLFIASRIDVHMRSDTARNRRAYNVTVDGFIPIKRITAVMDGKTVPMYEAAGREYLVVPKDNGMISVEVTLKNGQITRTSFEVCGIDLDAPEIEDIKYDRNYICVTLKDDSEINYAGISLTSIDGKRESMVLIDEQNNVIKMEYPEENLLLKVCDEWQNVLQVEMKTTN